ncbi:MAG: type II and III secretion system protein family protein, partial [Planctomycetota bacterium]
NSDNIGANPEVITFIAGESTIVKTPWPAIRIAVTDPTIVFAEMLTPEQALLQGTKVGSTDLIVWNEDGSLVKKWKVQVKLDIARFQKKLEEMFPDATLEVSDFGETLIVKGLLRKADQVVQLHDYLKKTGTPYVDMTSLAGVQQVLLEVKIAEASRQALRSLSINIFHTNDDYFGGSRLGRLGGGDIGVPAGPLVGDDMPFQLMTPATPSSAVTIFAGVPRANFEIFIQALAENQYLRLLANPTLVAMSGEQASFLAGGEFPIPITQGRGGSSSAITIQYKEYGVRVSFMPVVLGDGTIRLQVAPEVSSLSDVGAVTLEGFSVPALITRKGETTVELNSGQTFAMAGLLQNTTEAFNTRIPGLGDLPVLGPLFRSVRYQKKETELVVIVTASLVEPMSLAETPPLPGFLHSEPNDWEFYLEGRLESKEPAKIDSHDAEWLKQMNLDELKGPGAWDSYNKPISSSQADPATNPNTEIEATQNSQENEKE